MAWGKTEDQLTRFKRGHDIKLVSALPAPALPWSPSSPHRLLLGSELPPHHGAGGRSGCGGEGRMAVALEHGTPAVTAPLSGINHEAPLQREANGTVNLASKPGGVLGSNSPNGL